MRNKRAFIRGHVGTITVAKRRGEIKEQWEQAGERVKSSGKSNPRAKKTKSIGV